MVRMIMQPTGVLLNVFQYTERFPCSSPRFSLTLFVSPRCISKLASLQPFRLGGGHRRPVVVVGVRTWFFC
jgi:hypothetical protein